MPFYLFVSVDTVQSRIVSPFDTLAVHDPHTWLHLLTAFHTDMSTQFLQQQIEV